jgi:hypothetical protein
MYCGHGFVSFHHAAVSEMASSSKGKTKCIVPGFYEYLEGLRVEFELHSNTTSTSSIRFNIYLGGLKAEFELLKKERDELKTEGIYLVHLLR